MAVAPALDELVLERLAKRDINCNVSYRWPIHTMRCIAFGSER